jgi:hypothetical protein
MTYPAPWSRSLVLETLLFGGICIAVSVWLLRQSKWATQWLAVVPLAILCASALFVIRGYSVTPKAIMIHRLLWTTRLPLDSLEAADFRPNATKRSIRVFGIGGLFSFSGWFRNQTLGKYRAFVTDPTHTVVLRFPRQTIVISPSSPEDFIRSITSAGGNKL